MLRISIIIVVGIILLVAVVNAQAPAAIKFVLGIAAMYGISKLLGKELRIKDEWGLLMIRSSAGIRLVEALAKREALWKLFADLGIATGYGLLSFFMIRRPARERLIIIAAGIALLYVMLTFVSPSILPFLLDTIGTAAFSGSHEGAFSMLGSGKELIMLGLASIGGLALLGFAVLVGYAAYILYAAVSALFFHGGHLSAIAPGATLVLPGMNIPLVEGIAALALILVVHEGAHAVLARIARIRIISTGIVLLGVIPIGAFVEPDEERLKKLDSERQTRVMVAGSAANVFTSLALFLVLAGFVLFTAQYRENSLFVVQGALNGTMIHEINGQDALLFVRNAADRTFANQTLLLSTDHGGLNVAMGKDMNAAELGSSLVLIWYSNPALEFIYKLLGLAFSLNFVIAMVNLLPIQLFDGYRIVELNVKSKALVRALSIIAIAAFAMNFLPWIF